MCIRDRHMNVARRAPMVRYLTSPRGQCNTADRLGQMRTAAGGRLPKQKHYIPGVMPSRAAHFAACAMAPAWSPRSRSKVLEAFARPLRIEDISDFVREQRARYTADGISALQTPRELTYPCAPATAALLGIDSSSVSPELTG